MKKYFILPVLSGMMAVFLCACQNEQQNNIPILEVFEIESISESAEETQNENDIQISQATIDDVKQMMSTQEARAAELSHSINFDNLSQTEMNDKSAELYEVWDFVLNSLWNTLKKTLNEEEMAKLTIEEREWVEMKEQAVKESGAQFEGSSIYPLIVNLKAAELTQERVYKLLQLMDQYYKTSDTPFIYE